MTKTRVRRLLAHGILAGTLVVAGGLEAQGVSVMLGEPIAWQVREAVGSSTISGTVLGPDGTPLPEAMVTIQDTQIGALTDSLGRFEMPAPEGGRWILSIVRIGLDRVEMSPGA